MGQGFVTPRFPVSGDEFRLGGIVTIEVPPTGLDGDDALIRLFRSRRERLLAMVRRRVGPRLIARIDPEDVLQDVFVRAAREWTTDPPPPEHREWWLYRLAWRRTIELMRAALGPTRNADRDVSAPWSDESAAQFASDLAMSQTGVSTSLGREEMAVLIRQAIERLEPTDRDIVFLRFYESMPFKAIAAIVGLEPNTANQRCARALLKLKKYLPDV
jgi:RNA polymerase sigma-70 factor (ECF subfamily)